MDAPSAAPRSPLFIARFVVLALAILAFALLVTSGPGTRAGAWSWQAGIAMMRWATYVGMAAGLGALILLVTLAVPAFRNHAWVPVTALVLAAIAIVPPLMLLGKAKSVPRIHDISTDLAEPPAFVALLEARNGSPNGAAHGGPQVAEEQRKGYPDIKPLVLAAPPQEAMQKAIDAARGLGWHVAASDAAGGRLEATDTTTWFGFKDDVVVRIRPEGTGSRVDVRSVSRVGLSDLGANADRIRRFLGKLQ
ncbi:MAG TPA: DUF1499 domain-containing protein [Usitatibacter sp.]|nr:DUF1499 domain-containing protein [Usitatibacter sp.]